jgi:hypothetical protein
MDQRKRYALVAVIVLIVVPVALILLWRAWSGPGTLIAYTQSGGLTGTTERTVVYRDGRVVVSGGREHEFRLTEAELVHIEATLAAAPWPRQPVVYGEPVPDGFRTDISYDGHMVTVYEPAEGPYWLEDVRNELGIAVPVDPLTMSSVY